MIEVSGHKDTTLIAPIAVGKKGDSGLENIFSVLFASQQQIDETINNVAVAKPVITETTSALISANILSPVQNLTPQAETILPDYADLSTSAEGVNDGLEIARPVAPGQVFVNPNILTTDDVIRSDKALLLSKENTVRVSDAAKIQPDILSQDTETDIVPVADLSIRTSHSEVNNSAIINPIAKAEIETAAEIKAEIETEAEIIFTPGFVKGDRQQADNTPPFKDNVQHVLAAHLRPQKFTLKGKEENKLDFVEANIIRRQDEPSRPSPLMPSIDGQKHKPETIAPHARILIEAEAIPVQSSNKKHAPTLITQSVDAKPHMVMKQEAVNLKIIQESPDEISMEEDASYNPHVKSLELNRFANARQDSDAKPSSISHHHVTDHAPVKQVMMKQQISTPWRETHNQTGSNGKVSTSKSPSVDQNSDTIVSENAFLAVQSPKKLTNIYRAVSRPAPLSQLSSPAVTTVSVLQTQGRTDAQNINHTSAPEHSPPSVPAPSVSESINMMQEDWMEALALRSLEAVNMGRQSLNIQLVPERLGQLQINLSLHEQQIHLQLQAENPQTTTMIIEAEQKLVQMLEEAGIRFTGFQNGQNFSHSGGFQQSQQQMEQQKSGQDMNTKSAPDDVSEATGSIQTSEAEHQLNVIA